MTIKKEFNEEKPLGDTFKPGWQESELSSFSIIGNSNELLQALHCISICGQFDVPVLIKGETGTGKELAARGIHYGGVRSEQPFVAVNCATLTDDLFCSAVFGHKKGAFTDARQDKKGLVALAEKGTLFLDEVDSLSVSAQASLLRLLQESEYRPVGSEKDYKCDVRIVASANSDLEKLIREGLFRRDLYHRLYILSVNMPALRSRKSDIPTLVKHFLEQFSNRYKLGLKTPTDELLTYLSGLTWPGNVRELENFVHRLYLTCKSTAIDISDINGVLVSDSNYLQDDTQPPASIDFDCVEFTQDEFNQNSGEFNFSMDKKRAIEKFEITYIERMLELSEGNITQAAKLCGKERRAFGKLVKKYNYSGFTI